MKKLILTCSAFLLISTATFASNAPVIEQGASDFNRMEDSPAGEIQVGGEIARYLYQEMNVREKLENNSVSVKEGKNVKCIKLNAPENYLCSMMVEVASGDVY